MNFTFLIIWITPAIVSWNLPMMGGFRATGWAWILLGGIFALVWLWRPARIKGLSVYFAFLGYAVISLLWLDEPLSRLNVQNIIQFFLYIFPWVIARNTAYQQNYNRNDIAVPFNILLFLFIGVSVPFILSFVSGLDSVSQRPAALTLVLISACALGIAANGDYRGWILTSAALLICVLSGSRMAGTAIFVLIMLASFRHLSSLSVYKPILLLPVVTVVILYVFQLDIVQQRFFYSGAGSIEDLIYLRIDSSGRFKLWPLLFDQALTRPYFGHGAGAVHEATAALTHNLSDPLNDYLRVFYDYGLIGSTLYWLFFLNLWLRMAIDFLGFRGQTRSRISSQGFLALSGFFIISITDNPVLYSSQYMFPLFWLLGFSQLGLHAYSRAAGRSVGRAHG